MRHPIDFQASHAQIKEDPEYAIEVLVHYVPFNLHMMINEFMDEFVQKHSFQVYTASPLVGQFFMWLKDTHKD